MEIIIRINDSDEKGKKLLAFLKSLDFVTVMNKNKTAEEPDLTEEQEDEALIKAIEEARKSETVSFEKIMKLLSGEG